MALIKAPEWWRLFYIYDWYKAFIPFYWTYYIIKLHIWLKILLIVDGWVLCVCECVYVVSIYECAAPVHGIHLFHLSFHFISNEVHCDGANNLGHNDMPIITFVWCIVRSLWGIWISYLLAVISMSSYIRKNRPNSGLPMSW